MGEGNPGRTPAGRAHREVAEVSSGLAALETLGGAPLEAAAPLRGTESFEAFFEREQRHLLRFCWGLTLDPHEAERPHRARWLLGAAAAVLVIAFASWAAVRGSDRPQQVETPASDPDAAPGRTVAVDPHGAATVTAAAEATMAAPWQARPTAVHSRSTGPTTRPGG